MASSPRARYLPIQYEATFATNKIKGGANTIAEALGKSLEEVTNFLVRGTVDSIHANAETILTAVADYAVEWIINKRMIPVGLGLDRGEGVGVWTGSFMKSLHRMEVNIENTPVSSSGTIGIEFNPYLYRKEYSGLINTDYHHERVGRYGSWLMAKLSRFANGPALVEEAENFISAFLESVLQKFRTDYKVSRWAGSAALHTIVSETARLHAENEQIIVTAAMERLSRKKVNKND